MCTAQRILALQSDRHPAHYSLRHSSWLQYTCLAAPVVLVVVLIFARVASRTCFLRSSKWVAISPPTVARYPLIFSLTWRWGMKHMKVQRRPAVAGRIVFVVNQTGEREIDQDRNPISNENLYQGHSLLFFLDSSPNDDWPMKSPRSSSATSTPLSLPIHQISSAPREAMARWASTRQMRHVNKPEGKR